jgi:hypothetical protein
LKGVALPTVRKKKQYTSNKDTIQQLMMHGNKSQKKQQSDEVQGKEDQ